MTGRRRPVAWLVAVAIVIASCTSDPYPLHAGPPRAGQSSPSAIGEAVPAVVLFIQPRPGDSIQFLDAQAIGDLDGATVEIFFSPPIILPDGSRSVGDRLVPLAGAVASAKGPAVAGASPDPDAYFGIVARLTASRAGRFVVSNLRLRYRVNGGTEQTREGIDVVFTVCVANPRPTDCRETAPS